MNYKHELYCNKGSFLHLPRFGKKINHITLFFRFLRLKILQPFLPAFHTGKILNFLSATVFLLYRLKPLTVGSLSPGSLGRLLCLRSDIAEYIADVFDVEAAFSSKSHLEGNLRKCLNKSKGKKRMFSCKSLV